jgi:hypothetical protein
MTFDPATAVLRPQMDADLPRYGHVGDLGWEDGRE